MQASETDARASDLTMFTAGHGSRSAGELISMLSDAGVGAVADVRRFPHSRRHPQHDGRALAESLAAAQIRYEWLGEGLGGRVPETLPPGRSPNGAWREPAFRRYADYMASAPFARAFAALEALGGETPTALLCAERLWWQCHRRLIADRLVVAGWRVVHLLEPGKRALHELTPWARADEGVLVYPSLL